MFQYSLNSQNMDNISTVGKSKEQKQFNKQLTHHLEKYSYLRDWSQLALWLTKLKNMVVDYKGHIADKTTVLKKLATSLNPSLPAALHESSLEIYDIWFNKFIAVENLEFTCLGLFSYFGAANMKNRVKLVEMFIKYLPKYGKQLRMLATGLLITVFPSLVQMHEPLIKQINKLLEVLGQNQNIGHQCLIESIWIVILRSSSCRVPGLKYISNKLGKVQTDENDEDEDNFWNETVSIKKEEQEQELADDEDDENNKSKSKQKQKQKQDSVEKEKEFERQSIKEKKGDVAQYCPHIETLVTHALLACVQDSNILVCKNALDFLYKYIPLKSEFLSSQTKMKLCHSIIWLLEKRDMGVTRKINFWLFGKPDAQNKFIINSMNIEFIVNPLIHFLRNNNSLEPLKIIFNLFNEHEQMPALTMQKLAKQIVSFSLKQEHNQQATKLLQRLLDQIYNELKVLTNSLGKILMESIQQQDYRQADNILKLIVYLLNKILRPHEIKSTLFPFLKTIMVSYLTTNWKDKSFMKNALNVSLQIIDNNKQLLKEQSQTEVLYEHIQLYGHLINIIKTNTANQNYEQEVLQISKMLVKLYDIFGVYSEQWVTYLIENIFLNNPSYYLTPIEVIGEALEKEGKLKDELMKRAQQKKQNFVLISIHKLWNILSLGHIQYKVIPLILRLSKHFPQFFIQTLNHDFEVNVEMPITKFSLFWHLSPQYPAIINQQQLTTICKPSFFKMLNFLDNGNPLVKYNTKIWINECYPDYYRVLDPLLQIILQPKDTWYKTIKGQYIFLVKLDVYNISNCLKYLHSMIKHTGNKFYKFSVKAIDMQLYPVYELFKGKKLLEETEGGNKKQVEDNSYLRVIFQIVVRLLSSKFINCDNPGIDLTCCQLLETMIKGIIQPQLCMQHVFRNLNEILYSLHFATINNDHILQIQILNLLDTIFFQSNLRKSSENKKLKEIVSSELFTKTILQGLNTGFPYIKERFVQFINKSIVLFLEYHKQSGQLISQILNTYISKISFINSTKMQAIGHKDIEISKKNSEMLILYNGVKELLSYFLNLTIKPFEKEKNHNQPDAGIFSLYSWKSYVNLKIEKKYVESSRGRRNLQEISKHTPNELDQLLLTMTSCWELSQLVPNYKISLQGLSQYIFKKFQKFNEQLYEIRGKYQTQESVQAFIINLFRVLINKYPREIMNGMIKNWASANTVQLKIKIIQMLNMSSIPLQNFFDILYDSLNFDKLNKKRKSSNFVFEESVQHSILHFCQFFTHYSYQNNNLFQGNNLINIWLSFLKFVKLFENSKNVYTLFALIELVDLFMQKYNPKQFARDEKLKKDFQFLEKQLNDLVLVCNGRLKVVVNPQSNYELSHFIPFPTSVFQVYMVESGKVQDAKVHYMYFNDLTASKIAQYCRIYAFIILKRVSYHFLQVFCSDSQATQVKKVKEIISQILPVVEDKSQPNVFIQNASQIILSLLLKRKIFLREFKSDVLQIFNKDDFFICSSRTLHCWVQIIDMIIDNNKDHDIFSQYLSKVSLASSIFTSYTSQTKKKIKSFERICFILYAGKKDKYNDKIHLLIDKIIQVIKNTQAPQPVLILIFFCIRILILRTSPDRLSKLLNNVWQLIMFLLTNIFKRQEDSLKEKINLNLVWAALKLIQMISIMQMNEFHPHQWIFFYDMIGLKFTPSQPKQKQKQGQGTQIVSKIRPLISKYLPQNFIPIKGQIQKEAQDGHLIIKQDKIDDIQLLKTKALLLSSYLSKNNQCKMKFEMSQVESLIENDFLNLDQFIFKLK